MSSLGEVIARGWERRAELGPGRVDGELKDAIERCIADLDAGTQRVAEKRDGGWVVNQWLKQAVLLSFRINDNRVIEGGYTRFFDKVPSKYADYDAERFKQSGTRVVPDAVVRRGAFVAPDVVLMPSFVNIGAYVDKGSMIDTWATVGSCAQIGKNVHLSGGV
ncbi:MAG TPA: 2,3,4,5-tetrahydropyridine-2,6-dicarboxylate N-succinyltransferase, partial [Gammaproteobacteria bacterium]|nr:2,3,4,5-tetrahydropyridine-2,6-dicarboxylate N-succinyltransferase [Gammaproteobacteria bacterium]